jgi:hypothetical protein
VLVRHRTEEIPRFVKEKTRRVERTFSFDKSVFAKYIHDSVGLLIQCYDFDCANNKIKRFVKKERDQYVLYDFLR